MAWLSTILMLLAALVSVPTVVAPHRLERAPARWIATLSALGLGAATVLAVLAAEQGSGVPVWWARPVAVVAAVFTGAAITMAVLSLTRLQSAPAAPNDPSRQPGSESGDEAPVDAADPGASLLRGGSLIGVFERAGVASALLAGWPEGLAVVLALKGLGRFPELKAQNGQGVSERFILGTSVSVLVAAACAGLSQLLTLHA